MSFYFLMSGGKPNNLRVVCEITAFLCTTWDRRARSYHSVSALCPMDGQSERFASLVIGYLALLRTIFLMWFTTQQIRNGNIIRTLNSDNK